MQPSADASPFFCRLFGHRRSRRVWHEGDSYRAQCKRCGTDLIKPRGGTDWMAVTADGD